MENATGDQEKEPANIPSGLQMCTTASDKTESKIDIRLRKKNATTARYLKTQICQSIDDSWFIVC